MVKVDRSIPVKEIVKIDIDMELVFLEAIFRKYIALPEGVYYTNSSRLPLLDGKLINAHKMYGSSSQKPHFPVLVLPFLGELFDILAKDNNPNYNLSTKNPLANDSMLVKKFYDVPKGEEIEHVLLKYIPNILHKDYDDALSYISRISSTLINVFNNNPTYIHQLDLTGMDILIIVNEDILTYRYKEALEINSGVNAENEFEEEYRYE